MAAKNINPLNMSQFTDSLKETGQWDKFCLRRGAVKQMLQDQGFDEPDMSLAEESHLRAAREFGWHYHWRPAVPDEDAKAIQDAPHGKMNKLEDIQEELKIDYVADVAEAYQKINVKGLKERDFERPGAYSYYKLVQQDAPFRRQFLQVMVPKALGKPDDDDDDVIVKDAKAKIKNLDMFERISREVQES
jgi:hypothetical protein